MLLDRDFLFAFFKFMFTLDIPFGLKDAEIIEKFNSTSRYLRSKKISNDQELIQSDPISCPQNQKGNN